MDLVSVPRLLDRARLRLAVGAAAAVVASAAVLGVLPYGSAAATQTAGAARTRVLVDMPSSLIADVQARADTIGAQASLLSDLLATDAGKQRIAESARIPASELVILRPASTRPTKVSPLADDAFAVASTPGAYTLTIETATALPIVTFGVTAPDRVAAGRVAAAAVEALTASAAARADPAHALAIRPLDPVRTIAVVGGGKRPLMAVVAGLFVFLFWTGSIVVLSGLFRVWRAA